MSRAGDIERGDASGQGKDAIARADAKGAKDVGEPIGGGTERAVTEVMLTDVFGEPAERDLVRAPLQDRAIDRFMSDVQSFAVGQSIEQRACVGPGK